MADRISIAMATYNGVRFVEAQLSSFAAQSRLPDELIITDDSSTDGTREVLERFAGNAPFSVKLHLNPTNLGYAQNFSKALSLTSGDVVFLSDQDDVWHPDKIESMIATLEARPDTQVVLCDTILCDEELVPNGETKMGRIRKNGLSVSAHVMGCCSAIRRPFLLAALPVPDEVIAHDNWIVQMADELGVSVRLDQPMQKYRLHGGNASDFFVNRAEKQTWRNRLGLRFQHFARRFTSHEGMAGEHRFLTLLVHRIESRQTDFSSLVGPDEADTALKQLQQRVQTLSRRLEVRARPRSKRPGKIIASWRANDYRKAGLSGALKDLILPSSGSPT